MGILKALLLLPDLLRQLAAHVGGDVANARLRLQAAAARHDLALQLPGGAVGEGHVQPGPLLVHEAVAGDQDKNPDKDDEGLKAATNATDDWLYIDTLKNGQSGVTKLTVALDGESQANSYQSTKGQLKIAYGVENVAEGEIIYNHIPGKTVRTGDDANLLLPVLLLTLAAILLILTILSFKKDRKEGEEA